MTKKQKKQPTWSDVKTKLNDFDRAGLLGLVQDLYAANKDNKAFLHTRFGLGDDVLKPYKTIIERWLYPDVLREQDISVAKAKKAISDYKKAIGQAEGLAELTVFYCEQATAFCNDYGLQDEGYFDATVRMFEQALKAAAELPETQRQSFWARLIAVQNITREFGYYVGDEMDELLDEYGVDD
jgi:hypothetical protein